MRYEFADFFCDEMEMNDRHSLHVIYCDTSLDLIWFVLRVVYRKANIDVFFSVHVNQLFIWNMVQCSSLLILHVTLRYKSLVKASGSVVYRHMRR